jgi:hypothetical protein
MMGALRTIASTKKLSAPYLRAADHQGPFRPLAPKHQHRGNGSQTGEFSKTQLLIAPNLRSAATSLHCHQVDNCALFGCAISR